MHQPQAKTSRALRLDRVTLAFKEPGKELAYREAQFARSRTVFRLVLAFSIVLHGMLLYTDGLVLGESASLMWRLRLFILVPASAVVLLASFHSKFHFVEQPLTAVAAVTNIVLMAVGGALFGAGSIGYFSSGTVLVLIFGYVLLGLRFSWSAPAMILAVTMHVAVIVSQAIPLDLKVVAVEVLVFSVITLTVGAYRMELLSRAEYQTMEQLVAQERREREWLTQMAGFVRHELKNAMAGIGSSLQLIAATNLDDKRGEYLQRAARSLQFMRRFLEQVATATSLQSAVMQQESTELSLSELVSGCVTDARERAHLQDFVEDVSSNILVRGNADSLVQMIDKLLNNAIEHSRDGLPIRVRLSANEKWVNLDVKNFGDELALDTERLFQPFITTKAGGADGNLGLGLYVARVIASVHGGSISAHPLHNPEGACFSVMLPIAHASQR